MALPNKKPDKTFNSDLLKEISLDMGIPLSVVTEVINAQSKFTAHIMSNNEFNGVRWPYFGTFVAKHKTVQILSYMKGLSPIQKTFFLRQLRAQRKESYLKKKAENIRRKNESKANRG